MLIVCQIKSYFCQMILKSIKFQNIFKPIHEMRLSSIRCQNVKLVALVVLVQLRLNKQPAFPQLCL